MSLAKISVIGVAITGHDTLTTAPSPSTVALASHGQAGEQTEKEDKDNSQVLRHFDA